ncbi:hypothetical protein [Verrucosispora sp. WMMD573]|uniref:hypothetical protein n=1 Tax=Verrucosispora sp. WMMD573 TaxID=3015149 RepID=UPI00248C1C0F|nr:hypothetical protein [Verrucosispora sp. WMMD573]WBB54877.1 hypothetical protein O7601_01685 [Verrucosispora sp. WMMD573]
MMEVQVGWWCQVVCRDGVRELNPYVSNQGTAAWFGVHTGFGQVRNLLADASRPEEGDKTVEVRGRTSYGDITIHRS